MKYTETFTLVGMLVLFAVLLSGCSGDTGQAKDNYVKIISLKPALSETLVAGSHVDFEIGVKYAVQEQAGVITLVIQQVGSDLMPLVNEIEIVPAGEGRLTLSASFETPDTRAIEVITSLSPQGTKQSAVVDSRVYKVVPGQRQEPDTLLRSTRLGRGPEQVGGFGWLRLFIDTGFAHG